MNHLLLLKNIMKQRRLKLFKLAPKLGVSIIVLQNFLAGMPVKDSHESLITGWVESAL